MKLPAHHKDSLTRRPSLAVWPCKKDLLDVCAVSLCSLHQVLFTWAHTHGLGWSRNCGTGGLLACSSCSEEMSGEWAECCS